MSFLRGSEHYVWSTSNVLGKGATAHVYQGVNKETGEPVAVKTFTQISYMRPTEVQMREFEVLRKVNHENIVKLLAIEKEQQDNPNKVIIMELCTGGSLFNILDDPANKDGLDEKEFLLVLKHLTAGMKHLRDNNLVHRDLKPGNIMKFIADDGSNIYKLTDFGAARELQDGQQFNSLYGTEEYLHPDMYERAVLRKTHSKTFGATVDLWSIGVTLYHVATGDLPFRPAGGRRNKETMFKITTQKKSGVISGVQKEDNGEIEWKDELPATCQLSAGLKKLVTPLLAGLLEANQNLNWAFEKFFNEVHNILKRRVVYIFFTNHVELIEVFIDPVQNYEHMQEYIKEQTGISCDNQVLLFEGRNFYNLVEMSRAEGFPSTTENNPIYLFDTDNNNVTIKFPMDMPQFPDFSQTKPQVISVDHDAAQAKDACKTGYVYKRRIEKLTLYTTLIKNSVNAFVKYINNEWSDLKVSTQHLHETTKLHEILVSSFNMTAKVVKTYTDKSQNNYTDFSGKLLDISRCFLEESYPKVLELHARNVHDNYLQSEWESSTRNINYPEITKAPARVNTLIERLRHSWQRLVSDRATRTLSYNDEQFHCLERIKINRNTEKIKIILRDEVAPCYLTLSEIFGDWYKIAQTVLVQTKILKRDVEVYAKKLDDFKTNLRIYNIEYTQETQAIVDEQRRPRHTEASMTWKQNRDLKRVFKEAELVSLEIQRLVQENNDIEEKLTALILDDKKTILDT